jgi:hypothetical protein
VEKILKEMQSGDGRTPSGAGWVRDFNRGSSPGPLSARLLSVQVSGQRGAFRRIVVRVSVQVTAWYADPVASKSGYQLLTSNGRLEADLLDQLADQLAAKGPRLAGSGCRVRVAA